MQKWLIVGLGNPGFSYKNTRHNVGWWVVDGLSKKLKTRLKNTSCSSKIVRIDYSDEHTFILAKPQSFMNLSGRPVKCLMDANEISYDRLIVIHDDIDLPVGALRVRRKGSSGGQKGVGSIIVEIGNESFYRVKIGIGRPNEDSELDVVDYVLMKPTRDEELAVIDTCNMAIDAILSLVENGFEETAHRFNCINPVDTSVDEQES
ncbi:MAG TPA: aminoacyl-tRNA hydrolase [Caldisericia bacterium]|nr:aminoacyl-tRNA hydrolase [Caldisericia bacterium]HPF48302.1 aminoacyl-tRNA hydrolase [Caldisericia bacterium]HPI83519.1 aminoacyl-tRNA hydrolase [Caldisericia bacterium]HPQ92755.1 aminoacyl-tRNA hydrolase [Caldisericia bacterium]HRV74147.1 aminoacyl-tRNA hydrolase [Caldisericia bacterium]